MHDQRQTQHATVGRGPSNISEDEQEIASE
jgi:hypothetical protein